MTEKPSHDALNNPAEIFRDVPIGFCTFDLDLRFVYVNEWLAALNRIPANEHIGRTMAELIAGIGARVEEQLRKVIETGEAIFGGEIEAESSTAPDGKQTVQYTYTAIKDQ